MHNIAQSAMLVLCIVNLIAAGILELLYLTVLHIGAINQSLMLL